MKIRLLGVLLYFSCVCLFAQNSTVWEYPVKPGTKEWAAFKTGDQMREACQIPIDVLYSISTKDLVTVCLNYPLFNNYSAFNDDRKGVNFIIKNFNGLLELSKRQDGVKELIKAYENFPILSDVQNDVYSEMYHIPHQLPFLELILSDNIFLSQLNSNEVNELKNIVIIKYSSKVQNSNVYSLYNIKKSMFLAANILNKQKGKELSVEQQAIIKSFIENYNQLTSDLLSEMSKILAL